MTEGWRKVRLADIAEVVISSVDKKSRTGEEPVRLCNYSDVYKNNVVHSSMPFMQATATTEQIRKYGLRCGDIIITKDSEQANDIAVPTFVEETASDLICGYHLAIVRARNSVDGHFLKYCFEAPYTREYFKRKANGVTRFGLTVSSIERAVFRIPRLQYQRKIAEILRTWEEAIEKLEALRLAKQNQYKGLAKSFFDPCHLGFYRRPDTWKEVKLGDVFHERTESGQSGDKLLSITMSEGVIHRNEVDRKDTSTEDKSRYKLILPGDLGYNTMRMWQGVSGLSAHRGIVSPAYTVVTPDERKTVSHWAAHLFKSRRMVFDFERYSQGLTSDTWNLKYPAFSKIRILLPPLKQQEKQADMLDLITDEIKHIENEIRALMYQKRGLMQMLFTGE